MRKPCLLLFLAVIAANAYGRNPVSASLPHPKLGPETWVMVEVWPEVNDITLSAYFLDYSSEKNRNLCVAAKKVFDRDAESQSRTARKKFSSWRICLSLDDAIRERYIDAK